jgi:hypothetical protein
MKVCTVGRVWLSDFCVELSVILSSPLPFAFPSGIFSLDVYQVFVCDNKLKGQRITIQNFIFNFRNPRDLHSVKVKQSNYRPGQTLRVPGG